MGKPSFVKICGFSTVETATAAIENGATALGFMLAPSRRQVTKSDILRIREQLPATTPTLVAVVVNKSPASIQQLLDDGVVDAVQMSGDESPDMLDEIRGQIWKTLRFTPGTTPESAVREVGSWLDRTNPAARVLVDAAVAGVFGGTGHTADWDLVAKISDRYPITLAGGLDPSNVAQAIAAVRPDGVDVSSGVETDGRKDPARIAAFLAAAADAFARL